MNVRFYCVTALAEGPQLGAEYLKAFRDLGVRIRVCPIGPAYLTAGPWPDLAHLFTQVVTDEGNADFVNVVCAPPGLHLGATFQDQNGNTAYRPQTALEALYTAGKKNIAVTLARPEPPSEAEKEALRRYDVVMAPNASLALELCELGVRTHCVPP